MNKKNLAIQHWREEGAGAAGTQRVQSLRQREEFLKDLKEGESYLLLGSSFHLEIKKVSLSSSFLLRKVHSLSPFDVEDESLVFQACPVLFEDTAEIVSDPEPF